MLKVTRATLTEAVQIAGDMNRSWQANEICSMWLDDNMVLHINRKGVHFAARSYVGAWYEPEKPSVRKSKAEAAT